MADPLTELSSVYLMTEAKPFSETPYKTTDTIQIKMAVMTTVNNTEVS